MDSRTAAHYLVSTNGKQFQHPDKAAVARIITGRKDAAKTLHFNCPSDFNAEWNSASHKTNWRYRAKYGTDEDGLVVDL